MRALVTGAGGFVGPHLVSHLGSMGDDVVALGSTDGPDLRDYPAWQTAIGDAAPDVIYHLAGWSDVAGSWANPKEAFETNLMGAVAILDGARQVRSCRVVIVSSADVYGLVSPDELPLTEESAAQPRSPYGASKQAVEAMALQYHRGFDLDVVVARPFNHLGPGQSPNFAAPAFAQQIALAEANGEETTLRHGDLRAERDFTDVRDVVQAYRLMSEKGEAGAVYNVCSGQAVSIRHLLDTLLSHSPAEVRLEEDPDRMRPIDLPVLRGSSAKLHLATGWSPTYDLSQTLDDVLADARLQSHTVLESST